MRALYCYAKWVNWGACAKTFGTFRQEAIRAASCLGAVAAGWLWRGGGVGGGGGGGGCGGGCGGQEVLELAGRSPRRLAALIASCRNVPNVFAHASQFTHFA